MAKKKEKLIRMVGKNNKTSGKITLPRALIGRAVEVTPLEADFERMQKHMQERRNEK